MNYTNTLFLINLRRIRVTNIGSVENKHKGEKMKKKLILTLAMIGTLTTARVFAVENTVATVDKIPPAIAIPDGLGIKVGSRSAKHIYSCLSQDYMNQFDLAEKDQFASVTSYAGENLYEGGDLNTVSKIYGNKSVQTTFLMAQGGQLVITQYESIGGGGRGGRGGRGGYDPIYPSKTIVAKLTTNEKTYYFNCN